MKRILIVSALMSACLMLQKSEARACGNSVYLRQNEANRLIAKAEEAFKKKDYIKVRRMLSGDIMIRNNRLRQRRLELVSVANIRTGRITRGVQSLRHLVRQDPDDPYLLTRLAEGLSRLKKGRKEARNILEKLDKANLVADAEGYAVLAKLRKSRGDAKGEKNAAARCSKMTKDKSICPKVEPQIPQS